MIDFRRAAIYLPVYVAVMMILDVFFNSPAMGRPGELPLWLLFAFIAMAIAVFVIVGRYLFQRNRKAIPASTERAMLAILAGAVVSGMANNVLAGVVTLLLHTRSLWVMIPIYILTYLVFFAVAQWVLSRGARVRE